ncbi:MAG: hypothetical protein ABJG68_10030 [Crocinitomicaceae bacterium]
MKILVASIFLLLSLSVEGKSYLQNEYVIQSDVLDNSVPHGKCLITGQTTYQMSPLAGSMISTLNGSSKAYSDSLGNYSLLVDASDTSIFFFHMNYTEMVIWSYPFQSQHHVVIDFYAGFDIMNISVDKPVIYLYSEEDLSVSLNVNFYGTIDFSYPKLDNQTWKVDLKDNKIVHKGLDYPYLFWEGEMQNLNYQTNANNELCGEFVAKSDVISFLEAKLSEANFNSNEKADFITFWAPKMIENEYVFIQFLEDDSYSALIADLKVNPQPDNTKRLYMLYTGYESIPKDIRFTKQSLKPLKREGFTLVDWGGTELPINLNSL